MEKNHQVSLGCGTLILIALIVAIFSGGPKGDLSELKGEVDALREEVAAQTVEIRELKQMVRRLSGSGLEETTQTTDPVIE